MELLNKIENNAVKGKNALYEQFLFSLQCFLKQNYGKSLQIKVKSLTTVENIVTKGEIGHYLP